MAFVLLMVFMSVVYCQLLGKAARRGTPSARMM